MSPGVAVRIGVLGPIAVIDADSIATLSPQLKRLLGVLVVADGDAVAADRLAEYVANGNVEGSTVRTAVSRLRKVLGDRVESVDGGYRLVAGDELDAARFTRLRAEARASDGQACVALLTEALKLWRGPAFGDLADEEWATVEANRLDQARAVTTEDLAEALLAMARAGDAAELLEPHVAAHPFRERPAGLLMRALAADGRTAEALRAFQRFRTMLRDETGLDPSAELRSLEAELLASESPAKGAKPLLPDGTVTFVFTDIEGSTQRWQDDESAMTSALASHDTVLRSAVESHGGVVFKHTGDGICAVFTSAPHAVAAAVAAQKELNLPVRIGIHTGVAELRGGDYFGPTLNRVARIMDGGHGGQVLMSAATAALVPGTELADLGEHRLKGLSAPERILQVGTAEFPTLRLATARKGNLPAELTEFVGRADELDAVAAHVLDHRLVTLLGVGGTGKTRLAIEVASRVAPTFPDGCWMAELSQVLVAEAVPFAIAAGLGIREPERGDVLEHVIGRIRHQRLLLVVDNCEHVLEPAAEVVERLLVACPAMRVITTSREPLMVAGEHLVATPSLDPADAVALFLARARAEAPHLVLDESQLGVVEQLCQRLDRLPLAIELAASRLRAMTPAEILARLDERFRLLVGGRRSRLERHQTMRGTVDWSYELCTPVEQHVFDRVSVFVSGFDLDAARAVAEADGVGAFDVDDALARLVDRSLVQRSTASDGASRFTLLETMRAYGHEKLAASGVADEVRDRHAGYMAATAAALSLHALGPDEGAVHRRTRELIPDTLVALDWCIEHRDWHHAVRLPSMCLYSAPGVAMALYARLGQAKIAADGNLDGIDPVMHLHLEMLTMPSGDYWNDGVSAEFALRVVDLARRRVAIPRDFFIASTMDVIDSPITADDVDQLWAWLHELDDAPPAIRLEATMSMHEGLTNSSWVDVAVAHRAELAKLAAAVGSELAHRQCRSLWALQDEMRGDLLSAREHITAAMADVEHPSPQDVLSACRQIRIAAKLGLPVTGADLRRPFEWVRAESLEFWRFPALVSAAIGLDHMGYTDLAERAVDLVATDERRDTVVDLLSRSGGQRLAERVQSANEPRGDFDSVEAEILALADELDRGAAAAVRQG